MIKMTKKSWALAASATLMAIGGTVGWKAYQEEQKREAQMERNKQLFLCADEMLDSRFPQTEQSDYFKRIEGNLETSLSNEKNIRTNLPSDKHRVVLDSPIGSYKIIYDEAIGVGSFMAFEDKKNFTSDMPRRLQIDIEPTGVSVAAVNDATDDGTKPHYGAWLKKQPGNGQSRVSFHLNNLSGTAKPENVSVWAVDDANGAIAREEVQTLAQEWNRCVSPKFLRFGD